MTTNIKALSKPGADRSHMPLAVLCVLAGALVVFFLFVIDPRLAEIHAKAQALLSEEIAREYKAFCDKRGLSADAREHASCMKDLDELRAKQEKRIRDDISGLI